MVPVHIYLYSGIFSTARFFIDTIIQIVYVSAKSVSMINFVTMQRECMGVRNVVFMISYGYFMTMGHLGVPMPIY